MSEPRILRRRLITGQLADEIRAHLNSDADVYFTEAEQEYGGCPTCYGIDRLLIVECGDHRKEFDADDGLPINQVLDWLDEPRRQAKREAAERARKAEQAANDQAFTSAIVGGITGAVAAVEAEGYMDDQDWHDKFMTRLGVRGYGS